MKPNDKVFLALWGRVEPARVVLVGGDSIIVRMDSEARLVTRQSIYRARKLATAATLKDRIKDLRLSIDAVNKQHGMLMDELKKCMEALDASDETDSR